MNADLVLPDYSTEIERAADPAEYVVQACERAKVWLQQALDHGDIEQIVELKSQAEAIRVYTMSKQLGKDAQLSAAEIVRRAERGIGLAIRKGQETGEIATRSELNSYAVRVRHSRNMQHDDISLQRKPAPTDFVSTDDLSANGEGIYHLTDGFSDEQFEGAILAGKTEGNLSRASVVRRLRQQRAAQDETLWVPEFGDRSPQAVARRRELIRRYAADGYSSRQIGPMVNMLDDSVRELARDLDIDIPADTVMGRTKRIDSNRIVRETATALDGLSIGVGLINYDDLDPDEIKNWVASLTQSIRTINRLIKRLKEATQ